MSSQPFNAILSWLERHGCLAVLSFLSPATAVTCHCPSCAGCSAMAIMSSLSYHGCHVSWQKKDVPVTAVMYRTRCHLRMRFVLGTWVISNPRYLAYTPYIWRYYVCGTYTYFTIPITVYDVMNIYLCILSASGQLYCWNLATFGRHTSLSRLHTVRRQSSTGTRDHLTSSAPVIYSVLWISFRLNCTMSLLHAVHFR